MYLIVYIKNLVGILSTLIKNKSKVSTPLVPCLSNLYNEDHHLDPRLGTSERELESESVT